MDDTLDFRILLEHVLSGFLVTEVHLLESRTHACNLLNTVKNLNLRIGEVVNNHYLVTSFDKLYSGV